MSKKKLFNRIDTIKDATARAEIARAHAMVALLGVICIVLLWSLYASITITTSLVVLATILLACIVLFSAGVASIMLKSRK